MISWFTIGTPGFFLALGPNTRRYLPGFVPRVLRFAIPAGAIAAVAVYTVYALARAQGVTELESRTIAFVVLLVVALYVLAVLARPMTRFRLVLVLAMIGGSAAVFAVPPLQDLFKLQVPEGNLLALAFGFGIAGCTAIELVSRYLRARPPDDGSGAARCPIGYSCTMNVVTIPNIPSSRSACVRMWQWYAQTPSWSARGVTSTL